ncbi:MAG: MBL fold metallo-hydrolase [Caldimonas sp.]
MNPAFEAAGLTVLERGWLSSNSVLFASEHDAAAPTLIDSGYWSHAPQTVALVRHALQGRPLARIVNTHLHADHCGGNQALQQAFDCAIDVPAGEAANVDRWDESALTFRATGQHCPRFVRTGAIAADAHLNLGGQQWQALASPGHDPQSFVLYQPDLELLISADALWENGFGVIFPELDGDDGFGAMRATLERLRGLRVRWVIPGHGRPFDDFDAAVDRASRRLDGLVADPARHARHAAKVLIKFHLMELQAQAQSELDTWLDQNGCIAGAHRLHFADRPYHAWCAGLIDELQASGALRRRDGRVENV